MRELLRFPPYDRLALSISASHRYQLHVIERLHYVDPNLVAYDMTIDDPKIFTAPWTQNFQMKFHPTWKVFEFVCEENNRCEAGKCSVSDVQQKNNGK